MHAGVEMNPTACLGDGLAGLMVYYDPGSSFSQVLIQFQAVVPTLSVGFHWYQGSRFPY